MHGVTGYGGRFRKLAQEHLARFRVLAPDLRGHGESEWEPPWRLETFVDDLLETIAAVGVERAAWIGHSFGGRLVLELAAREPDRVERAVLLDPAVWVPPPLALERAEAMRVDVSFGSAEEAVDFRLETGGLHHAPRELVEEEAAAHLTRSDDGRLRYRYCRSAVIAAYSEMSRPPPLDAVRAPTLLVHGEQSDIVPSAAVALVRDQLGDRLETVAVPGGHTVLWDAFDETAAAVESFVPTP